jgi:hypothetical protein
MQTYMLDSSGYLYNINIIDNITNATRLDGVNIRFKKISYRYSEYILLDFYGKLYTMKHHNGFQAALNMLVFGVEIINFINYCDCMVLIDTNYDMHIYNRSCGNTYTSKLCHIDSVFRVCVVNTNITLYVIDKKLYCLHTDNILLEISKTNISSINNGQIYICECKNECMNHNTHTIDSLTNIFNKYSIDIITGEYIINSNPLIIKTNNDDGWSYNIDNKLIISSNINLLYAVQICNKTRDSVIYVDGVGNKYNIVAGAIIKNLELNDYHVELPTKLFKKRANKFT